MRVALFARYSSRQQDELSLDAQIHEMERHCEGQGWQIVARYLLPETPSSEVEKAPEFQAMLEAAKAKRFECILVHKLDRFGRNREFAVTYKAMLRRAGVQVRSVVENLGDSIFDRLVEGMIEVVSEFYSLNLGQETKKGQRQATRRGWWTGGKVPFGYRKVSVEDERGNTRWALEPHPEEGPVMATCFEMLAQGASTLEILNWVERQTLDRWSHPTFYTRIRNPLYYGRLEYGRTSMPAGQRRRKAKPEELVVAEGPALVSQELWEKANQVLKNRGQRTVGAKNSAKARYAYMLTGGVARCSHCGRNLVGSMVKGLPYYRCVGRRDRVCPVRSTTRADKLDAAFAEAASNRLADMNADEFIADYTKSLEAQLQAERKREKRLQKKLVETRQRKHNLMDAIEQGAGASTADILDRISRLTELEHQLAEELATCSLAADQAFLENKAMVEEWMRSLGQRVAEADPKERKEIFHDLFHLEWDLIDNQGEIRVRMELPENERSPATRGRRVSGLHESGRSARI